MDSSLIISSSSTFDGSKLGLTSTQHHHHHPKQQLQGIHYPKFNIISCRATTKNATISNNLYKLLSLHDHTENVSLDEIKKAYRTMALQYHPDVCHPSRKDESARRFVELHKAYKVLSDPISRRKYDLELGLMISKSERIYNMSDEEAEDDNIDIDDNGISRDRWIEQLYELKRRSQYRTSRNKENQSWRSRW